jgi:chemotaxis protein CheD
MSIIRVGISEFAVSKAPAKLITIGLGSCVGIAVYEKNKKVGGLSHILLPDSNFFSKVDKPEKFADLALPLMIDAIISMSGSEKLEAKIAGGASMFYQGNDNLIDGIGQKNIKAVTDILNSFGIPIIGSDTGGNAGRTMTVDLTDFKVTISTVNKEPLLL